MSLKNDETWHLWTVHSGKSFLKEKKMKHDTYRLFMVEKVSLKQRKKHQKIVHSRKIFLKKIKTMKHGTYRLFIVEKVSLKSLNR